MKIKFYDFNDFILELEIIDTITKEQLSHLFDALRCNYAELHYEEGKK